MNSNQNNRVAWLRGPAAKCSEPATEVARPWRLVLLGAPGVGKGTQAALLARHSGACHLSTGDVFREATSHNLREQTLAMSAALNFMSKGSLVPDAIVWQLVRERADCLHCAGGFLLDGFPRTLAQAGALRHLLHNGGIELDAVVSYELPNSELVSRLSGRRTCANCKAVFHLTARAPHFAGVCDSCGGVLYQREDDQPEAIAVRLEAYERSTAPLIEFYRNAGLLVSVSASGEPEQICIRTLAALELRRLNRTARPEMIGAETFAP